VSFRESRLKDGTLNLGPTGTGQIDMSCQITNAVLKTAYTDDGDPVTVLCGTTVPAGQKVDGRTLDGTIVQDFDYQEADGGVIDYLWNHELEVVDFSFVPNTVGAPTITGQVQLTIPEETYGGDVETRLTSDFSFKIQGEVDRAYAGGGAGLSADVESGQAEQEPAAAGA
jgi:hypothetical protein